MSDDKKPEEKKSEENKPKDAPIEGHPAEPGKQQEPEKKPRKKRSDAGIKKVFAKQEPEQENLPPEPDPEKKKNSKVPDKKNEGKGSALLVIAGLILIGIAIFAYGRLHREVD